MLTRVPVSVSRKLFPHLKIKMKDVETFFVKKQGVKKSLKGKGQNFI